MKRLAIILACILLLVLAGCAEKTKEIRCASDTKVCPDGTTLSRRPPSCEFAACPAVQAPEPVPQPALSGADQLRALFAQRGESWKIEYTTTTSIGNQTPIRGTLSVAYKKPKIKTHARLQNSEVISLFDQDNQMTLCIKRENAWNCSREQVEDGETPEMSSPDTDVANIERDYAIIPLSRCSVAGRNGTAFRFNNKQVKDVSIEACYGEDGLLLRSITDLGTAGMGMVQRIEVTSISTTVPDSEFETPA